MAPRRRSITALAIALLALGLCAVASVALSRSQATRWVEQPLRFSHATHVVGEGLECIDCHGDAEHQPYAGLPDIQYCHDCHKSQQGEHPDEDLVREFARRREQIPFRQASRNVGHVYFSHRMHREAAGLSCDSCHPGYDQHEGGVSPINLSLLSMKVCMDCHAQQGASNECVVCHK